MSASKAWIEEGGAEEDIVPAQLLQEKKLKLGWPQVAWNPGTERLDFLYIRHEHSDVWKQCWKTYKQAQEQVERQHQRAVIGLVDQPVFHCAIAQRTAAVEGAVADDAGGPRLEGLQSVSHWVFLWIGTGPRG